ncbi:hypothetical protein LOK49_LG11G02037 [Camellia lanceoleosa]|uniref:Uncharacterized protein n=1 Tax=Camellia lanceoleosa TaxID=1840588 RepID=A0ACC0G241_9ERIC|nr:hypothetical protein LOK49_LG11G02037 [Camellia lanceoleosa]
MYENYVCTDYVLRFMQFPIDLEHYDRREQLKKVVLGRESHRRSSSMCLTLRPEAMPMDFLVRPQSKIDPDEVRPSAKQVVQDQHCLKMQKQLQQLKAPKKKQLQATKLSVEGRGMVKYL